MLDFLRNLDVAVFYFCNHALQNQLLDWLMPIYSDQRNWYPLFGVVYVLLWWKGGKRGRLAALLIIPVILLSDQLSSAVIKPLVGRMRPCVELDNVRMLIGLKTSYSFPSSHAANSFAAAALFAHFFPGGQWAYYVLAFISAFSRIYVGVHYPSDVLAGALLGIAIAWLVIRIYDRAQREYAERRSATSHQ